MKTFKLVDIIISTTLIITFCGLGLIFQDGIFITGYFIVGGWQIVSMLIHLFNHSFTQRGAARRNYQRFTAIILIIAAVFIIAAYIIPDSIWIGLIFSFIMLFAAPIMAIYYTTICYREYLLLKEKALTNLR